MIIINARVWIDKVDFVQETINKIGGEDKYGERKEDAAEEKRSPELRSQEVVAREAETTDKLEQYTSRDLKKPHGGDLEVGNRATKADADAEDSDTAGVSVLIPADLP